MTRTQRRALKANAVALAARLAESTFDFEGGALVPVSDPKALGALRRAMTLMLRAGGEPVAVPVSEAEASGFPCHKDRQIPGAKTWLAVGLDVDGRGTYALHSVWAEAGSVAHDVARGLALARLEGLVKTKGFKVGG